MSTGAETAGIIPAWLPERVLEAIISDATKYDSERADRYSTVDLEGVRHAIDRADNILRTHGCIGDQDAMDMRIARSALLIIRGLIRPVEATHGD